MNLKRQLVFRVRLSSQIETSRMTSPIGWLQKVLRNITPDHLLDHGIMRNFISAQVTCIFSMEDGHTIGGILTSANRCDMNV